MELDKSDPSYFISGAYSHCQNRYKLEVVVMSEKHGDHDSPPIRSPTQPATTRVPYNPNTNQEQTNKGGCFFFFSLRCNYYFYLAVDA